MVAANHPLFAEVLALPHDARAFLAERLLASLEEDEQPVSPAWRREILDRQAQYKAGLLQLIPAPQVHQDIRTALAEARKAR